VSRACFRGFRAFQALVPELFASRDDINDDILHLDLQWH